MRGAEADGAPAFALTGRAVLDALAVYRRQKAVAGLLWWSTWEGQWCNATLFDRAVPRLRLAQVDALTLAHPAVQEAAEWFGLRPMSPETARPRH